MNKRDSEQLRASIAKDLVQGQGEHSPTKELLKQYAPLEGILTTPTPDVSPRPGRATPVEMSLEGKICQLGSITLPPSRRYPFHLQRKLPAPLSRGKHIFAKSSE